MRNLKSYKSNSDFELQVLKIVDKMKEGNIEEAVNGYFEITIKNYM